MVFKVKKKLTDKKKHAPGTECFLLNPWRQRGILYWDVTNFSHMRKSIKCCFVSIHFNQQGFSQAMTIRTVYQVDKVNSYRRVLHCNVLRPKPPEYLHPAETKPLSFRMATQIDFIHLLVRFLTLLTYSWDRPHENSPKQPCPSCFLNWDCPQYLGLLYPISPAWPSPFLPFLIGRHCSSTFSFVFLHPHNHIAPYFYLSHCGQVTESHRRANDNTRNKG